MPDTISNVHLDATVSYSLLGIIGYAVGSCHDDRSIEIKETITVPDGPHAEAIAIEKAREIIKELHKKYSHLTDYTLGAGLHVVKEIWETYFEEAQPAVPARPARKEKLAIPAQFTEKLLK